MKLKIQTPLESFSKQFKKFRPFTDEFDSFAQGLITYRGKINFTETEEHFKAPLRELFRAGLYSTNYEINTSVRADLAVFLGKTAETPVGVLIETKRPNAADMIRHTNLNTKAFWELILYYFDERIQRNNFELKHLVATDFIRFYIFNVNSFDRLFYENPTVKKLYETRNNDAKKNDWFYAELAKLIAAREDEIECIFFDLDENKKRSRTDLIQLYKVLSPYFLLKEKFADDSNTLNKKFYAELLHILGLEEIKDKSKQRIQRVEKERRQAGSLIENTITILKTKDSLRHIDNADVYGVEREQQYFNVALELCLTWVNRVLFLKLLEAQLVGYHNDASYKFLNYETISEYDELFLLFHRVLAVRLEDRSIEIKSKFQKIPYLNSSLFEISELEDKTITVESLRGASKLPFSSHTVLAELKAKNQQLSTLEYLFRFLDAFDFASETAEELRDKHRQLINASVLGKVCEKINNYKEGAIYTPGFITMYMCRQAIRPAVVSQFNERFDWDIETFDGLKNKLDRYDEPHKILEFNEVINSLRICDPAVGSGHFLVSALNELIAVKHELGILADESGKAFRSYDISVVDDELDVTDADGKPILYQIIDERPSPEAHRFQRVLFHEKQTIIENCLFGVDINPNSVKICRLRLWIELLKNAYYKESTAYKELETLPNIDINIKQGNSLISRFGLKDDLAEVLKRVDFSLDDYRGLVTGYKETRDREIKRDFETRIARFKVDIRTQLSHFSPERRKRRQIQGDLEKLRNQPRMFEESRAVMKIEADKIKKLETNLAVVDAEIKTIEENVIYKNAFEWRFEFPEVLDASGTFIGFDVVIANPPFIDSEGMVKAGMKPIRDLIVNEYETARGNWDMYIPFMEKGFKILNEHGNLIYITPDKWISKPFGEALRTIYLKYIASVVEAGRGVFESSLVDSIITKFEQAPLTTLDISKAQPYKQIIPFNTVDKKIIKAPYTLDFLFSDNLALLSKIEEHRNQFSSYLTCESACATSDAYKLKPLIENDGSAKGSPTMKVINTGTVGRYVSRWGTKDMTYLGGKYLRPVVKSDKFKKEFTNTYYAKSVLPKVIIKGLTLLDACIDPKGEVIPGKSTLVVASKDLKKLKVALALIHSTLFMFYISRKYASSSYNQGITFNKGMINDMPLPKLTEKWQKEIVEIVDRIIMAKQKGEGTADDEATLDRKVFDLYGLTDEEIELILPAIVADATV